MKNENIAKMGIKHVSVYARVSTSNQEDQKTIDAQLSEVDKYIKENELVVVKTYKDEGWSGDILARPQLDQLRHDATNKIWDAVVIYDPDRLGRELFLQQIVINELKKLGIEILFVTMLPVESATDKLLFGVRGLFAAYEKAKIAERFRIGKVNRVKNNQVLTTVAPYGYTYIPNKGKKSAGDYDPGHYKINDREAEIVRNIFSWVANDGLTLRAVVRKLHEQKIYPRKSKRGVWNTSTLSTLLRHEVYIGVTHWGASFAVVPKKPLKNEKYKKIEKTSRKMKPKDEWYKITVPVIITDNNLFKQAGARLKKNFATLGRNKKNDYLLAGKIWCTCGKRRAGEGPQRGKYLYYRCTDRVYSFPLEPDCRERGINARIADKVLWGRVKEIMSSPELLQRYTERWIENHKGYKSESAISAEGTLKEIEKLQVREDRLANAFSKEAFSLEKFKEYVAPIREEIRKLEDQIIQADLEKTSKNDIILPGKDEIKEFTAAAAECLKNFDFQARQKVISECLSFSIASQKSLQVEGILSLSDIYVKFFSENRDCRFTERG
ncbi:hypothetical protein A3A95_04060 [Candidatus Nomurabacteria bacterium RIFCSPLOWO2_01_FULL_39_18]|uniref:Resolvase/invertase-type recombinase catalytic domain-containing protein n=1 Tax=Candidatus Nomurabacteria bacterium RIFCSPHIGHO2_01_FULL_40_24b TaxID=1801739 RepID=A0A1F6V684_9BACT|nr:MAG: hypothetical protein A2647_04460 [Candidatus Nomurabacteria bacterium RIFCSPHIGHO2_01_FULL_40_24b]OGI89275.1 MAG: hypothetical protein A3A95_04060 [Candidatus Nomurabacteria bacterium RIFCSPLOWO2_01_FULL_39_18]